MDMSMIYEYMRILQEADDKSPFATKTLKVELLDVEDFIKKNNVKEITNPIFFVKNNIPTSDGLLSNEIFGITKDQRANIYGYINLQADFLHPLVYKIWRRMDSNIIAIVHGTKTFSLDKDGYIVEDPNGETGVSFLKKNIDKIHIKETGARKRNNNISFIMNNKKRLFMSKLLVQPPYYRDVLTGRRNVEVGSLNKYYSSILISARSLKETQDFGFSLGDATKGRIQETLLNIYNCLAGNSGNPDDGKGLSSKTGIINEAGLAKTVDYGARLVLSAPELKVEHIDDLMVDMQHCALPLAATLTTFKPFIVFAVKRFFENEFGGQAYHQFYNKEGKLVNVTVKDPLINFSDERIEKEIKRFILGFSNRFDPVSVPIIDDKGNERLVYLVFKGREVSGAKYASGETEGSSPLINRRLTWLDVLYMAAIEATEDKHVLITRYPIDSAYNQFPNKIRISTLKETEHVLVDNKYYHWYPKLRESDIGTNTSNKFIDTLNICNLYLKGICGDYDGDTAGIKGVWIKESNEELDRFLKSKSNYIDFSGSNIRQASHEAIQSLYSLTKVLSQDKDKLTKNIKF